MSVAVAEGVVEVTADAKGVGRDISREVQSDTTSTRAAGMSMGKSIFGGVVGAWAAIGGTKIAVDFFSGAITGASDLNETLSKSSAIFGDNAAQIESWGDSAAKNVGLSKEAAIAAAASFGDMFTQIGFTGDAATSMSQSVVQAAADLGSFSNLETADVADRIAAAFRGEYDSLQAVIPNINAARVQSEALAMTGKTVASELTAQEKAAAVLAIVQKDGARAMGDFARTSDGAANQQKILTASLKDQQTELGTTLLPLWNDFLGFLISDVVPALTVIVDWISQNAEWLGPLALGLGVATAAVWLFNIALNANPIMLIITAVALLVGAILWLATQTTFFQDLWTNVTNALGAAWMWLWDNVLNPVFTAIGAVFTWIYETIILPVVTAIMVYIGLWAAVITWLWETIIAPVFAQIGAIFGWIYDSIIAPIVGYITLAIQGAGIVFRWLYSNIVKPVFDNVAAAFKWVWGSVIKPVIDFINVGIKLVGSVIRDVFGGIGQFIGNAFQSALNLIRGPINGIIGLVNNAISGLNSLSVTIPDWVPIVGGSTWGLNLPHIPYLARGSNNAPDAFIAGENGPELITGARGATVRPYDQTRDMLAQLLDGRGGDGGGVTIMGDVVLDAKNVREWSDVVDMLQKLGQTARAGRKG